MRNPLGIFLDLIKIRVSAAICLTAAMGALLHLGRLELRVLWPVLGAFFLAAGASAINQVQDRRADALMARTRSRPLPAGRIGVPAASAIGVILVVCGALALLAAAGPSVLALGLFGVFWYNGVYYILKRKSAFAVVPGAWIGALPPVIGWVGVGGAAGDPRILAVAFFIGVWQVPHFWLLTLLHEDDYEKTGLPSLRRACSPRQLALLSFVWIAATVLSSFGLVLAGFFAGSRLGPVLLALLGLAVLIGAGRRLFKSPSTMAMRRRAFREVNLYALAVLLILCWVELL